MIYASILERVWTRTPSRKIANNVSEHLKKSVEKDSRQKIRSSRLAHLRARCLLRQTIGAFPVFLFFSAGRRQGAIYKACGVRSLVVDALCSLVACRRAAWTGVSELAWVVVLLSRLGLGMKDVATMKAGSIRFGLALPGGYGDGIKVSMKLMLTTSMELMIGGVAENDGCVDDDG